MQYIHLNGRCQISKVTQPLTAPNTTGLVNFQPPNLFTTPRVLLHIDPEPDTDRVIRADFNPLHQPGNDHLSEIQLHLFCNPFQK